MIDLEFIGECTLSIAAVRFNKTEKDLENAFYRIVDMQSCVDAGLKLDTDTIYWWLAQREEARNEILALVKDKVGKVTGNNRLPLEDVLAEFKAWFRGHMKAKEAKEQEMWSFGGIDFTNLERNFKALGVEVPYRYRLQNDCRTILRRILGIELHERRDKNKHHTSIEDCIPQIDALQETQAKYPMLTNLIPE